MRAAVRRVAVLSVHTSPLDQPGTGDAGGMNVYVLGVARELARLGVASEVFTRALSGRQPDAVELEPGITVRHVRAGAYGQLDKHDLPALTCAFAREVLRVEAAHAPGRYDVVHSHYWLSGQVGAVVRDRWGVPLVHTMHTTARVKNASLGPGDTAEPRMREVGELDVVRVADRLLANTAAEAAQLTGLYDASPDRIDVVHPGVDLATFVPQPTRAARVGLGLDPEADVVLFVGRLQPLKGPDILLRAVRHLLDDRAGTPAPRLVVPVLGGLSGSGLDQPRALQSLVRELGLEDVVRLVPAVSQAALADWYAAASVVCVPSRSESFGLVALEAQACGTPVLASRVGGLPTAVRDGVTGVLVDGHDPWSYAAGLRDLLGAPQRLARLGHAAARHARGFGWDRTARETLAVYDAAIDVLRRDRLAAR